MAEHEKPNKKPGEIDRKPRVIEKGSKTASSRSHDSDSTLLSIGETPFRPPAERHAEMLSNSQSSEEQANIVMQLQQTYGNRYVQRLMRSMTIQAKLTVNPPNDSYEQEADRVADAVTKNAAPAVQKQAPQEDEEALQAKHITRVQRQGTPEDEDVQTKRVVLQRQENPEDEEVQTKPATSIQRQTPEEDEEKLQTKRITRIQRQETPGEEEVQTKPTLAVQRQSPEEDEEKVESGASNQPLVEDEGTNGTSGQMDKNGFLNQEEEPVQTSLISRIEDEEHLLLKPLAQRQIPEEEEDEKIQAKSDVNEVPEVTDNLEQRIRSAQAGGAPLPDTVRSSLEPQFGSDFSAVRVHSDAEASKLSRELSAEAFTTGKDVFFGEGRYQPETDGGKKLLAHELTHVVQQTGSSVKAQRNFLQRVKGVKALTGEFEQSSAIESFEPDTLNKPKEMTKIAGKFTIQEFIKLLKEKNISFQPSITAIIGYFNPVTLADLTPLVESAGADERKRVWSDSGLMTKAEVKLGKDSYLTFVTQLGMHYAPATTELSEGGKEHTAAPEADRLIRDKLDVFVTSAVKAGRQIEGKVAVVSGADWDRAGEAHYGQDVWQHGPPPKTPKKDAINGFVDSKGRVWVERNSGNPGTLIHEGIHKYSDGAVLTSLSFNVNEGMTEYFARIICKDMSVDRANYEAQFQEINRLAEIVGKATIAAAYFDGKVNSLKTALDAARKNGTFDKWAKSMSEGKYDEAREFLSQSWWDKLKSWGNKLIGKIFG